MSTNLWTVPLHFSTVGHSYDFGRPVSYKAQPFYTGMFSLDRTFSEPRTGLDRTFLESREDGPPPSITLVFLVPPDDSLGTLPRYSLVTLLDESQCFSFDVYREITPLLFLEDFIGWVVLSQSKFVDCFMFLDYGRSF